MWVEAVDVYERWKSSVGIGILCTRDLIWFVLMIIRTSMLWFDMLIFLSLITFHKFWTLVIFLFFTSIFRFFSIFATVCKLHFFPRNSLANSLWSREELLQKHLFKAQTSIHFSHFSDNRFAILIQYNLPPLFNHTHFPESFFLIWRHQIKFSRFHAPISTARFSAKIIVSHGAFNRRMFHAPSWENLLPFLDARKSSLHVQKNFFPSSEAESWRAMNTLHSGVR